MTKKTIVISVEWGYDNHTCSISNDEWALICDGFQFNCSEPYLYEGQKYTAEWSFNITHRGSLLVTYDDAGVGFDGELSGADIYIDGNPADWK
jgi:uncharacterized surface anchored protein